MKDMTIQEVADVVGVSYQAIYKKVKKGELNRNADKKIQFAEVLRLYPNIKAPTETLTEEKKIKDKNSTALNLVKFEVENEYLKKEVESLKNQLQQRIEEVQELNKRVDKLIEQHNAFLPAPKTKKSWKFW